MTDRMRVLSRRRLQGHLELLGISERELARRAELGHSTVNFLVHGDRIICTRPTAEAIERVLQVIPGDLFTVHETAVLRPS